MADRPSRPNKKEGSPPTIRRVLLSALAALTVGVAVISLIGGFSPSFPVRLLQGLAVFGAGVVVIGGAALVVMLRLAGWRDPESEEDFEAIVRRAEELAARGGDAPEPLQDSVDEEGVDEVVREPALDPYTERGFAALVRAAIDELPLEFHAALEHVAVVVSDGGSEHHAYGVYEGDTVARDYFHDRIVIFRDTLLRDFGRNPELLKDQVTRTVRHELAHHLGWGERGVRGLGL
ncbi:MAG: metallopeptidase family protein [Solirubrobacterales bacterium]|nr:metallopeptidase family protein [Solirubrobacterales bacterium]MBV9536484.1 metallopeptidase family protein [Solirubrobacterales bacterium]